MHMLDIPTIVHERPFAGVLADDRVAQTLVEPAGALVLFGHGDLDPAYVSSSQEGFGLPHELRSDTEVAILWPDAEGMHVRGARRAIDTLL